MAQSDIDAIVREIGNKLSREEASKILLRWQGGYPIRGYPIDKLMPVLINAKKILSYLRDIYNTLEIFNFSCIIGIIGELGSGKTQIGYLVESSLKKFNKNLSIEYISLGDPNDVYLIASKIDELSSPGILIIDEIDAVLAQLSQKEKEKNAFIHVLSGYLVGKTKNQKGIILLLTQRSFVELQKENPSLRRIITKDIVRYIGRLDNLEKREIAELAKRILALMKWSHKYPNIERYPNHFFDVLINFAIKYSELMGVKTIGVLIKILTEVFDIIANYDYKMEGGVIEKGKMIEEIIRKYLDREFKSIEIQVEKNEYVAYLGRRAKTEVGLPDIEYKIYPGKYPTGKPIISVYLEVKTGTFDNIKRSKEQLIQYATKSPLIIFWVGRGEPNELEEFISELETKNIIDYIYIPESVVLPTVHLEDPYNVFEQIADRVRIKDDILFKFREDFYNIIADYLTSRRMPKKKPEEVEEVREKPREIVKKIEDDLGVLANQLIIKLKPYDKDGKRITLGNVKKVLKNLLEKHNIKIDEKKAESMAKIILKELELKKFLERKGERSYLTIKEAWISRKSEAAKIIKDSIENSLTQMPMLPI